MPTVLSEGGFQVRIYTLDHPPPHVHVERAGAVVKISLATAKTVRIVGTISDRDVRRAELIVTKHLSALKEAWINYMVAHSITAEKRERFARARALGRRQSRDPSAVIRARYVPRRGAIELEFVGGGTMMIPRELIPELEAASPAALTSVTVSPAGDALAWRVLDIDLYIPGLVERAFGTRVFAASSGRRGGRRSSKAKAAAARANGAKGGRPRKQLPA